MREYNIQCEHYVFEKKVDLCSVIFLSVLVGVLVLVIFGNIFIFMYDDIKRLNSMNKAWMKSNEIQFKLIETQHKVITNQRRLLKIHKQLNYKDFK